MDAENIISFSVIAVVALFMMGIGWRQRKSQKPVNFYTGEKPFTEEQITDVKEWNHKHGNMWIIYGSIILLFSGIAFWVGNEVVAVFIIMGIVFGGILCMVVKHEKMVKKYKKR